MAEIAAAFVTLVPSFQGFGLKMDSGISPAAKASGTKAGKIFGDAMGSAIKLGSAAVGALFFKSTIGAASDLAEAQSKVGVVFGKSAGQIIKASNSSATAMGLSKTAYLDATGTLGNLLVSLDLAPKKVAGMSQEFVKLAGDLASFNNVSPEEALAAIKSGLTGETEPLKAFGVNMNDATLKAQALKDGLIKNTKEALSPQAKALAASALIMKQTGTAQGDFARTSQGLANQQRILAAQFADSKTKIGTFFLPIAVKAVRFLNNTMIPAFSTAAGAIGPALAKVGDFAKPILSNIQDFVASAVSAFQDLAPKVKNVFDGIAAKISGAFDATSLGDVGAQLATQAAGWAKPIIAGFKTGLSMGDWSGLGQAIGTGLIRAVSGLSQIAGKLGTILGDLLAEVDWVGIGIAIGKQAPSLLVGLAAGLLNFDLFGLLKGLGAHWQDILLAVVAIAFTPAKIVGKVGEALARIPLAGKLLQWALLHFKSFSDGAVGLAGKAVGFLGKGFLTGFRRVFPTVGAAFGEALRILPTRLGVMALEVQAKALQMIKGVGTGISRGTGAVAAKIGEFIGIILRPFAKAGSWLLRSGQNAARGLGRGIGAGIGAVVRVAGSIVGRVVSVIAPIVGRLATLATRGFQAFIAREKAGIGVIVGAAGALIGKVIGAISGLAGRLGAAASTAFQSFIGKQKAKIGEIISIAKSIPGRVKGALGNLGGLLVGAGGELVNGLIRGITAKLGALRDKMRQLAQTIKDHLPGSPVKMGPLTSWNGGGAGKRLVGLLADGLGQTAPVDAAMGRLAGRIAAGAPGIKKGLAAALAGGFDKASAALDKLSGHIEKFYDHKFKSDKKSAAASKTALKGLRDEYKAILANAKAHDVAKASLDAANQAGADIASSAKDYGSLTNIEGADILDVDGKATGEKAAVTAADIAAGLKTRLAAITNFSNQLAGLRAKGLGDAAIQTIAAAGVESGAAYASALTAATPDQIKAINSAQQQIVGASTAVGTNAVAGLVAGLTNDLAAVDAAGATIADRLRNAIRAQLGLKGGKKGEGKSAAPNNAALKQIATRSSRLTAATLGTTGTSSAGRLAPLAAGDLVIRETIDLDKYSRQQAFRERMFNVGGR